MRELTFDRVIVDEAHHIAKPEIYNEMSDSESDSDDERRETFTDVIRSIKCRQRVLFSATLDNPDYTYDLRQAINDKVIEDYDITVPLLDGRETLEGLAQLLLENPCYQHVLAYCGRLEEARNFQIECLKKGISCGYLDGEMGKDEREFVLDQFRKGIIRVIGSVGTISEGINLNEAVTCLFVHIKRSQIAIVQCVGRVLRKCEGKLMAHVILPSSEEGEVMKVFLDALSSKDTQLKKERIERTRGRASCAFLKREESGEQETREDEVGERILMDIYDSKGGMKGDDRWMYIRELVREFAEINERLPTQREIYKGVNVGSWISTQRVTRKGRGRCLLTDERIRLLETIKGWTWREESRDGVWKNKFGVLSRFYYREGRLPERGEDSEGVQIGNWASAQKQSYKGQSGGLMIDERAKLLESLPGWEWGEIITESRDDIWRSKFDIMVRFYRREGRLPKQTEIVEGVNIGSWISTQRTSHKDGLLSEERIRLLESLDGRVWGKQNKDDIWVNILGVLLRFVNREGRLPRQDEISEEIRIGRWVDTQRQSRKGKGKGLMNEERIKLLEAVPYWEW